MNSLELMYTPEQDAVIADWCRLYGKGKSVDFRRIEAEDGERWRAMNQSKTKAQIRAKIYYHRMKVLRDVEPKPSLGKRYPKKKYQCRKCEFTTDTKQSLGVHYRYKHPKAQQFQSKPNGLMDLTTGQKVITATVPESMVNQFVIVSPDGTVRLAKLIKHCPECLEPLMPLNVARNI